MGRNFVVHETVKVTWINNIFLLLFSSAAFLYFLSSFQPPPPVCPFLLLPFLSLRLYRWLLSTGVSGCLTPCFLPTVFCFFICHSTHLPWAIPPVSNTNQVQENFTRFLVLRGSWWRTWENKGIGRISFLFPSCQASRLRLHLTTLSLPPPVSHFRVQSIDLRKPVHLRQTPCLFPIYFFHSSRKGLCFLNPALGPSQISSILIVFSCPLCEERKSFQMQFVCKDTHNSWIRRSFFFGHELQMINHSACLSPAELKSFPCPLLPHTHPLQVHTVQGKLGSVLALLLLAMLVHISVWTRAS